MTAVLLAEGVHKRFGGVHALKDARIEVLPGEVHALVGENGSGKSTLLKILSGQVRPDAARVSIDGRATAFRTPNEALRCGHRDRHSRDHPRTRAVDRRERLPRPQTREAAWADRLADDATPRRRLALAARARPRSHSSRPTAAQGSTTDGRDRARPLDRRSGRDPGRADELAHRRRGRGAVRHRPQAASGGGGHDLRVPPPARGLRAGRPRHRSAGRSERRRRRARRPRPRAPDRADGRTCARGRGHFPPRRRLPGTGPARARTDAPGCVRGREPRRGARRDRRPGGSHRRGAKRAPGVAVRGPSGARQRRGRRPRGPSPQSAPRDSRRRRVRAGGPEAAGARARHVRSAKT